MINVADKSTCSGCTACATVCPQKAIMMRPDVLGFFYPVVNVDKCVDCGLCDKVCCFNDDYDVSTNLTEPIVFAARHNDINEIMGSRSGAIFVALSDYVLEHGGVVYGAGYDGHFHVAHKRAVTKQDRNVFRGSKYVQSDINNVFELVNMDLLSGLTVLFSGTPCQTAGLKSVINKKLQQNLLLVDLICDGVPAPNLWRDYISYLEDDMNSKVTYVNFRDKGTCGWHDHKESFIFESGEKIFCTNYTNKFFYSHIGVRKSCAKCPYTNTRRPSDITLGDFWGYENLDEKINEDDKGVNVVLINSEQGKSYFERIKAELLLIDVRTDAYKQSRLLYPAAEHSQRDKFENDYAKYGFKYVYMHNYNKSSLYKRIIKKVRSFVKNGK